MRGVSLATVVVAVVVVILLAKFTNLMAPGRRARRE